MTDDLGDRMKAAYELPEAHHRLMPRLPVVARLDGRRFSQFTADLERPYDRRLSELMVETARYLVTAASATVGYTQSDEITLVWVQADYKEQMLFDGKVQKLTSVLAAEASVHFNAHLPAFLPEKAAHTPRPVFDCRVWAVPDLDEAANAVLWRELDATKNAVSMAARHYYDHRELHEKSAAEMQEMLFAKGVNFNDYPNFFKRGTYVRRRTETVTPADLDLASLPPLHRARTDPAFQITRSRLVTETLPKLTAVANRVDVLFRGADPLPQP